MKAVTEYHLDLLFLLRILVCARDLVVATGPVIDIGISTLQGRRIV